MRIWTSKQGLLDMIQEIITFKAGLLLEFDEILRFLEQCGHTDIVSSLKSGNLASLITLRAEEIEQIINDIRVKIGNLTSSRLPMLVDILKEYSECENELENLINAFSEIVNERPISTIESLKQELKKRASIADENIINLFIKFLIKREHHSILSRVTVQRWDKPIPLKDLFTNENLPDDPSTFIDQRFIDYLSSQPEDLYNINWRKFEGLVAEFFHRNGYQVQIGPGRGDGGIDIKAIAENNSEAPKIILIQCKRYKKGNLVKAETVKALYFDVTTQGASKGLIATTSFLDKTGKQICEESRKYNLIAAEHDTICQWLQAMRTKN